MTGTRLHFALTDLTFVFRELGPLFRPVSRDHRMRDNLRPGDHRSGRSGKEIRRTLTHILGDQPEVLEFL